MKETFPYPLPETALDEFKHPDPVHVFNDAYRHQGEILAANGYVAIRAHRGAWLEREFTQAPGSFLDRFELIPWRRWPGQGDENWRFLADHAGDLKEHAPHGLWLRGRLAPSPVWRVNEILVRLSLLQLCARLPRAEVYVGRQDAGNPLWIRFSGGRAAIAHDKRLTLASREIFKPARDLFTQERIERRNTPLPSFKLQGWPPPECVD